METRLYANGALFIETEDGKRVPLGPITEFVMEQEEPEKLMSGFFSPPIAFEVTARINKDEIAFLLGVTEQVLMTCPGQIRHQARHGRKLRTRKKNLHRAFRWLEKETVKEMLK